MDAPDATASDAELDALDTSVLGEPDEGLVDELDGDTPDLDPAPETTRSSLEEDLAGGDPAPATTAPPAATAETPVEPSPEPPEARPFTYTADKQERTFEGASLFVAKDGTVQGAVFPPDTLQRLQQRLSKADHYEVANQQLYAKTQEFEALGGPEKLAEMTRENAKLVSAVQVLAKAIESPEGIVELMSDPTAIPRLQRELGLAVKEAEWKAREQWQRETSQRTASVTEQSQVGTALDQSITHWATAFPNLTPDDLTAAREYFGRLQSAVVRKPTPEEARSLGIAPTTTVVDHPVIHAWFADRARLRAEFQQHQQQQQQQAKASTEAATRAADENARRLAGTISPPRGQKPQPSSRAPHRATATPPAAKPRTTTDILRDMAAGRIPIEAQSDDDE